MTPEEVVKRFDEYLSCLPFLRGTFARFHEDFLLSTSRYQDPRHLSRYRARVYSQNGEDGMIAEILHRLQIPWNPQTFIEIGAGDGEQNNTRFLLEQGWSGIWCESDPKLLEGIRKAWAPQLASGQLTLFDTPVDIENVRGLPGTSHVLSIDIDMNTSHVWRAMKGTHAVVVVEYNSAIPACVSWEVPYDPAAIWQVDTHYGASLKRLEEIGRDLGYTLVGCELSGINAFFVREDLCGGIDFILGASEVHYEPARFGLCSYLGHWPKKAGV